MWGAVSVQKFMAVTLFEESSMACYGSIFTRNITHPITYHTEKCRLSSESFHPSESFQVGTSLQCIPFTRLAPQTTRSAPHSIPAYVHLLLFDTLEQAIRHELEIAAKLKVRFEVKNSLR